MNQDKATEMNDRVTLDTSFLVNLILLGYLQHLCKVFSEVVLSPEVWKESYQFHSELNQLHCIRTIELTKKEEIESNLLHNEFIKQFPGKHLGEIETLVLARSRGYYLVISDNFAPWYIRKSHEEYSNVKIFRGTYFFGRLIELEIITIDSLEKLKGTYAQKDITRMKRRLK